MLPYLIAAPTDLDGRFGRAMSFGASELGREGRRSDLGLNGYQETKVLLVTIEARANVRKCKRQPFGKARKHPGRFHVQKGAKIRARITA